ncbi:molybdopterin-dependent oxidoreductase [Acidiphilium sp.]|uniref:nitrate reductase n=1 Tax=Acidiphilium sp. TaxID=527 RepID=UPI003CFC3F2B
MNTTCPYCGVGCGLIAGPNGLVGDAQHPANRGRLCVKGATLGLTLDDRDRLVRPSIGGCDASWAEALDLAAARFGAAIAEHGPESVAFYVSGQFLTEDYYVANKLMKGFIGSGNIDTNSRLCMASPVAAHIRAFGEDLVPGVYDDFDQADVILFTGSNAAWCHPILFQRALRAREARGTRIVVIDPRRSATAELADLHVPVPPGGDLALFAALLVVCAERGVLDHAFIRAHTTGFDAALAAARGAHHGLDENIFAALADLVVGAPRLITAFSQGVNQSAIATDTISAIINLHLATGRIGKPGACPFSLTGQPNAMGGREVGGLANQLAAHLRFDDPAHHALLARFWNAPRLATRPGLKAVDLFDAVHDGRIKALWIAATNPAESLPRSNHVREALARCPTVVAADCWATATTARAHIVLPAAGWSEKDGTGTNSERMISRQRAFRPAPGEAKPDWWMFAELGRRLGHGAAFDFANAASVFREHAALSAFENAGERVFNLAPLAAMPDEDYDALRPLHWPITQGDHRLFGDGRFSTTDRRARFVPTVAPKVESEATPFVTINTGRLRDQWHSMTRTGSVPELMAHRAFAALEIAPEDATAFDIADGDLVAVTSNHGTITLPAVVEPAQRRGSAFAAMHWTEGQGSAGTVNQLIGSICDPISGEPAYKHGKARLRKVEARWHGIALGRAALTARVNTAQAGFWSRTPRAGGLMQLRFTGTSPLALGSTGRAVAGALLDLPEALESLDYADIKRGVFRLAVLKGSMVQLLLHIARDRAALPHVEALEALFAETWPAPDAGRLLIGLGAARAAPAGRVVCVCHQVSEPAIRAAIASGRLTSVEAIGVATLAGTGCGSCVSELKGLLRHELVAAE